MEKSVSDNIHLVILKGLFYWSRGSLRVESNDGSHLDVFEVLLPLVGKTLQVLAHHDPALPLDKHKWGGSCCFWKEMCPAGHQENPSSLYYFFQEGILTHSDSRWWVKTKTDQFELEWEKLVGHKSRLVAVNTVLPDGGLDTEKFLSVMKQAGELKSSIEAFGELQKEMIKE